MMIFYFILLSACFFQNVIPAPTEGEDVKKRIVQLADASGEPASMNRLMVQFNNGDYSHREEYILDARADIFSELSYDGTIETVVGHSDMGLMDFDHPFLPTSLRFQKNINSASNSPYSFIRGKRYAVMAVDGALTIWEPVSCLDDTALSLLFKLHMNPALYSTQESLITHLSAQERLLLNSLDKTTLPLLVRSSMQDQDTL